MSKLAIIKGNYLPENTDEADDDKAVGLGRFPSWLHRKLPEGGSCFKTGDIIEKYRLNTVCEEAKCPNRFECYSQKTATFLALGKACSRACGFCDIDFTKTPKAPEADEPERIAFSVKELGLEHAVITMVARDDLPDGGAAHLAQIIHAIRKENPQTTIEVLTSDFQGDTEALDIVLSAKPEVFNHNIETVRSLTPKVRHKATYERTLAILRYVAEKKVCKHVKSGLMVGLGETEEEVKDTIRDLQSVGCDMMTIGHYLQPNRNKLTVKAFISPEQFLVYEKYGHEMGITHMFSGPFVRSSYHAALPPT